MKILKLLGIKTCPNCGSTRIVRGYYSDGYNNWCQQACGNDGIYCYRRGTVTFDKSFEERKAIYKSKAPWCTISR